MSVAGRRSVTPVAANGVAAIAWQRVLKNGRSRMPQKCCRVYAFEGCRPPARSTALIHDALFARSGASCRARVQAAERPNARERHRVCLCSAQRRAPAVQILGERGRRGRQEKCVACCLEKVEMGGKSENGPRNRESRTPCRHGTAMRAALSFVHEMFTSRVLMVDGRL